MFLISIKKIFIFLYFKKWAGNYKFDKYVQHICFFFLDFFRFIFVPHWNQEKSGKNTKKNFLLFFFEFLNDFFYDFSTRLKNVKISKNRKIPTFESSVLFICFDIWSLKYLFFQLLDLCSPPLRPLHLYLLFFYLALRVFLNAFFLLDELRVVDYLVVLNYKHRICIHQLDQPILLSMNL